MTKIVLSIIIVLSSTVFTSSAQEHYPLLSDLDDTLYLSPAVKFIVGDDIRVGPGSTDDGSFKYIRIASTSWTHYNSASGANSRAANQANSLPSSFSGLKMRIKKIRVVGNSKRGYVPYLILGGGTLTNYECDIQQAIKAGEVTCPDCESLNKKAPATTQTPSIADELTKLKKLKDDGVLTEEEFQQQKRKLLEK